MPSLRLKKLTMTAAIATDSRRIVAARIQHKHNQDAPVRTGRVWSMQGPRITVAVDEPWPEYSFSDECVLTVPDLLGEQLLELKFDGTQEINGRYSVVNFRTTANSTRSATQELRANTRFRLSKLLPMFAYVDFGPNGVIPFRVDDISHGGACLISKYRLASTNEITTNCTFEAPGIGSFSTGITLRGSTETASGGTRLCTELDRLTKKAVRIVSQCVQVEIEKNDPAELYREGMITEGKERFTTWRDNGAEFISDHNRRNRRKSMRSNESRSRRSADLTPRVLWNEYAQAYDIMCESNPAYQQNLAFFGDWLRSANLAGSSTICDIGAGTGNYLLEVARILPDARLIHLDRDPRMNLLASRKYRRAGLQGIQFESNSIEGAQIRDSSIDLAVCVNALYTFGNAPHAIASIFRWLRPGGIFFIIDLGRPMQVASWTRYIVGNSLKTTGVLRTLRSLVQGRDAVTQNRQIRREQKAGHFWMHDQKTFSGALEIEGFVVERIGTCYRDACDFAICRRPAAHL